MKILFLFLLITVASFHLAVVAAEPERVIYSEDFSGSTLPGVKTENGHSYMSGCEFDVNKVYNGCRYWGDVEIRQSIRFPKQFPKHFCISVKNGGGREKPDYMLYYITFTAGGLSFYAHGLEKNIQDKKGDYRFKDSGFEGFNPDVWYHLIIRCEKDRLKISIGNEGGKMIQVCDAEVFPGSGSVRTFSYDRKQKVSENPFDIADVEIVELSTAPTTQTR